MGNGEKAARGINWQLGGMNEFRELMYHMSTLVENSSTWETETDSEVRANLVYIAGSRTARATQGKLA